MNAPAKFELDQDRSNPTPSDLEITVRDQRFNRNTNPNRWWAGEPFGTAWHNALSATFPRGEAFFIEAVKAHREGASPKLEAEIRAFVEEMLALTKDRPVILNLAVTMALEHYTAMMAHEFLANPKHFAKADPEVRDMWRWHAIEEIEHKGVAYDTWLHATKDWSAWQRWKVRSLIMLSVTGRFFTWSGAAHLPRLACLFQTQLPSMGS